MLLADLLHRRPISLSVLDLQRIGTLDILATRLQQTRLQQTFLFPHSLALRAQLVASCLLTTEHLPRLRSRDWVFVLRTAASVASPPRRVSIPCNRSLPAEALPQRRSNC